MMHPDVALRMISDVFWTGLILCAPVMGITLLVGIAISIVQVVTQIHDTTLTFIPKLLTAGVCLVIFGGWMLRKLSQYSTQLWQSIPNLF